MANCRRVGFCFFLLLFALIMFAPSVIAAPINVNRRFGPAYSLFPKNLVTIEDEAFEGTNLSTIFLQKQVVSIKERAFAEVRNLGNVFLSESVSFIGNSAFQSYNHFIVYGNKSSYAFSNSC